MSHRVVVRVLENDEDARLLHNFNTGRLDSLHPHYAGGRPAKFTEAQSEEIARIALGRPADHGLPFSAWSLSKLADYVEGQGVVDDISHEGLRVLLRNEGVSSPGHQVLGKQHRPGLRGEEEPRSGAIRDRRREGGTRPGSSGRGDLHGTISGR